MGQGWQSSNYVEAPKVWVLAGLHRDVSGVMVCNEDLHTYHKGIMMMRVETNDWELKRRKVNVGGVQVSAYEVLAQRESSIMTMDLGKLELATTRTAQSAEMWAEEWKGYQRVWYGIVWYSMDCCPTTSCWYANHLCQCSRSGCGCGRSCHPKM